MRILKRADFKCACGNENCTAPHLDLGLWFKLNRAAVLTGVSSIIGIRCGSRCSDVNSTFGGSYDSPHMHGNAVDIYTDGLTNEQKVRFVQALARLRLPDLGARPGFIHIGNGRRNKNV